MDTLAKRIEIVREKLNQVIKEPRDNERDELLAISEELDELIEKVMIGNHGK